MPICSKCGEDKPDEAFAFQSRASGKRRTCCRRCAAQIRRVHYLRTRSTYIENERMRLRRHRALNQTRILQYLREHPCVDCGETDPVVLDFDHRDPKMKHLEVALLARKKTWPHVLAEIEKCEVRCVSCHRRRTAEQFAWRRAQISGQRDETTRVIACDASSTAESSEVRTCRTCYVSQPIREFAIRNARTGRRSTQCKKCHRAYAKQHYEKNRVSYIEKARRGKTKSRDRTAAFIIDYLGDHPCIDCGETDVVLLEFDHRDARTKRANIGDLIGHGTRKDLLAEIGKCDVRCVRCHRMKTALEFGWRRLGEDVNIYPYAGVA